MLNNSVAETNQIRSTAGSLTNLLEAASHVAFTFSGAKRLQKEISSEFFVSVNKDCSNTADPTSSNFNFFLGGL